MRTTQTHTARKCREQCRKLVCSGLQQGVRCSPNPSMPESLELLLVFVFFLVFLGEFSEEHRSKKKLQFTWQFEARQRVSTE